MAPQLKKGDKVYLLIKNFRTKQLSKGLDYVKVGPFLIKEQRLLVNYTLDLPSDAKIFPTFYILVLELVDPKTLLQTTFYYETKEENEFEVEEIMTH